VQVPEPTSETVEPETVQTPALLASAENATGRPELAVAETAYVDPPAVAPLGATVTIWLKRQASHPEVQVPLGAVLDDGGKTGVWVFDSATSTVHFRPVNLVRVTSETAVISGLSSGDPIVSLGAQLLHEGTRVRIASESEGTRVRTASESEGN